MDHDVTGVKKHLKKLDKGGGTAMETIIVIWSKRKTESNHDAIIP